MAHVDLARLRRVALDAQGLIERAPFGRGRPGALRALERLGYVQIDTISVVARAHDHTFWTRVPGYRSAHLSELVARREAFEYWSHAAAFLPMRDYRYELPRMNAVRAGDHRWLRSLDRRLMARVLDRIRAEGALRARDFENPEGRRAGWWDWKPAKRALEQLFMQGDLMVSARDGFEKTYDLAERVLPPSIDTTEPTPQEWASHLIERALAAHGFATLKGFTYGRRSAQLRSSVKSEVDRRTRTGELEASTVENAAGRKFVVYAGPGTFDARSRAAARVRILCPFDNAIIQRDRTVDVHDYDYQIECYVPAKQRKFGYFCLPLLYRDRFVGRMDCKAHRADGVLEIRHLAVEHAPRDVDAFFAALAEAVAEYAAFNDCAEVRLTRTTPRTFASAARSALTQSTRG